MKIYLAQKMTGLTGKEILSVVTPAIEILTRRGFDVLSPAIEEGVQDTDEIIGVATTPPELLSQYWQRDKELIGQCDVLIDLSAEEKSEGVAHEIGIALYRYGIPVIRIYSRNPVKFGIQHLEDAFVCTTITEACDFIDVAFRHEWQKELWKTLKLAGVI